MIDFLSQFTLGQVKFVLILLFIALMAWVWRRPKSYIIRGAPDDAWWRDLRLWASGILILQVCIYLYF